MVWKQLTLLSILAVAAQAATSSTADDKKTSAAKATTAKAKTTTKAAAKAATTKAAATAAAPAATSSVPTALPSVVLAVPTMPQTTSLDPTTECEAYYFPSFVASEWPTVWDIATSNGMNTSAEFIAAYNKVDWSKVPDIAPRTLLPDGSFDFTGYNAAQDPDCWWSASMCTIPKHANINADIYKCNEPETWGLSYDDGPNCSHNAFYDFLQDNNLKATFFYIGSNVLDWPYGAMRGLLDGHHIGDHTWSHRLMTTLTNQEVFAELYYTQKAIKMVLGITPKYWRPAFGDVDDRVRAIASQMGLTAVIWNYDTNDWAAGDTVPLTTVEQTYQEFIEMGSNGSFATGGNIVLTHEINNTTMSLAVEYVPQILKTYKHVLDVATCSNITYPYLETEYSFPSFANATGLVSNSTTAAANGTTTGASASAAVSVSTKTTLTVTMVVMALAAALM